MKRFLLIPVLILTALLIFCAAALAGIALLGVRLARRALGDQLTRRGNQLFRLAQRLGDAIERLDAALRICGEVVR